MEKSMKTSKLAAIIMSIASIFSMVSMVLKIVNQASTGRLLFQMVTTSMMLATTILLWIVYFKKATNVKAEEQNITNNQ